MDARDKRGHDERGEGKNVMQQESVTFPSAGLKLSGTVRVPDGVKAGEKRAAFLVLHGFGSNKDSGNVNCADQGAQRARLRHAAASTCAAAARARASSAA